MKAPSDSRQQAFDEARRLITVERSKELVALSNWKNGGVLGGARRPDVPPLSDQENEAIKQFWLTLDGSASWMTALYMLRNNERPD